MKYTHIMISRVSNLVAVFLMTLSVCAKCGARKIQSFGPCDICLAPAINTQAEPANIQSASELKPPESISFAA